jgi:Tfp pilus assembly protein PilX
MHKKAFALVLVLGILAVLIVGGSALIGLASGETRMVRMQDYSMRAFYLAEAGIEEALYRIKKGSDFGDFPGFLYGASNEYNVDITPNAAPSALTAYTVDSTASYPDLADPDRATRRLRVNVDVQPAANADNVTNAIEVNGSLTTSGAVVINGGIKEGAALDFDAIFGITKAQMEALADNKYLDPANNKLPVDKITWVNLQNQADFRISQAGWSGSGILVVKAPPGSTSPALEITGGVFNGVIWVIGDLRISGNVVINGAIFVESGSAEVTKVTGTPVISYSSTQVVNAFSNLGNVIVQIYNWQEVP